MNERFFFGQIFVYFSHWLRDIWCQNLFDDRYQILNLNENVQTIIICILMVMVMMMLIIFTIQRTLREIRILLSLKHENIIDIRWIMIKNIKKKVSGAWILNMIIFLFINRSCFIYFNYLQLRFLTILLMIAFISFYILWKPGNLYYILPGTSCASTRSQFWRTFTLSRYLHLPHTDAQVVKVLPQVRSP